MAEQKRNTFEVAYEEAFDLACRSLEGRDIETLCDLAGAKVNKGPDQTDITLNFLNKDVQITLPGFEFSQKGGEEVHIWEKILILHYLANASDSPLTRELINYRQVKDGSTYFSTFEKRSTRPFVKFFGNQPEKLMDMLGVFGAERVEQGDFGIRVSAFPWVPVYFIIWKGDEEFPPDGSILFDSTIEQRLSAEDIAVLCQQMVFKFIKNIKN